MNCMQLNIKDIDAKGRKPLIIDILSKTHASIIGFSETKKENFSDSYLKSLVGNKIFLWNFLPSKGSAGGILVGVHSDIFDVVSWEIRDFSVSCILRYKNKDTQFRVISVYGSPYEEGKEAFISELHSLFIDNNVPTLIGGDFNLVRF